MRGYLELLREGDERKFVIQIPNDHPLQRFVHRPGQRWQHDSPPVGVGQFAATHYGHAEPVGQRPGQSLQLALQGFRRIPKFSFSLCA